MDWGGSILGIQFENLLFDVGTADVNNKFEEFVIIKIKYIISCIVSA